MVFSGSLTSPVSYREHNVKMIETDALKQPLLERINFLCSDSTLIYQRREELPFALKTVSHILVLYMLKA